MRIPSANPEFNKVVVPGTETGYVHGADKRTRAVPLAFQITSPLDPTRVLLPHTLVSHVNPSSFSESFTQKVERFQTRGGFQEQHWGTDLTEISADASTGAFMHVITGLTSVLRQRTIAWDRYRDLHDLYKHNGSVYDPFGNIVLQGFVMLLYDRGMYLGSFRSFETEETEDSPFAFRVSWSFKIEHTILSMNLTPHDFQSRGAPGFQSQNNRMPVTSGVTQSGVS